MRTNKTPVPSTTRELYVELGKAVLEAQFRAQRMSERDIEHGLRTASHNEHINAATQWIRENRGELRVLKSRCIHAKDQPQPLASLISDLDNNVNECFTILEEMQPRYLAEVFQSGMDNGAKRKFLLLFINLY